MSNLSGSLGRRVGWVALGRIGNTLSVLAINVIFARLLIQADYGLLQQVGMMARVAAPLFLLGLPMSLSYFLPQETESAQRAFVMQTILLLIFTASIFGLSLWGLAGVFAPQWTQPQFKMLPALVAVLGGAQIAVGFWEPLLINSRRHSFLAVSQLISGLMRLILMGIGWMLGKSLIWILMADAAFALLRLFFVFGATWHILRPITFDWSGQRLSTQMRYALPLGVRDGIDIVSGWLDKLIVTAHFNPTQFAVYFNGAFQLPFVDLVIQSVRAVVMPDYTAAGKRGDLLTVAELHARTARHIALLLFPLTIWSWLFGPDLMAVLFGEAYRESGSYFRLFALVLPARIVTAHIALMSFGRADLALYGTLLDVLCAGGLGLLLIPQFGLYGPALASVIGAYGQITLYYWQLRRLMPAGTTLLIWPELAAIGLLALGAGALVWLALLFSINSLLRLLAGSVVFGVIYALFGWRYAIFSVAEKAFLIRKARQFWVGFFD